MDKYPIPQNVENMSNSMELLISKIVKNLKEKEVPDVSTSNTLSELVDKILEVVYRPLKLKAKSRNITPEIDANLNRLKLRLNEIYNRFKLNLEVRGITELTDQMTLNRFADEILNISITPVYTVYPLNLNLEATGAYQEFYINAADAIKWDASVTGPYTLDKITGEGPGNFIIRVTGANNTTTTKLSGSVSVSIDDGKWSKSIELTQNAGTIEYRHKDHMVIDKNGNHVDTYKANGMTTSLNSEGYVRTTEETYWNGIKESESIVDSRSRSDINPLVYSGEWNATSSYITAGYRGNRSGIARTGRIGLRIRDKIIPAHILVTQEANICSITNTHIWYTVGEAWGGALNMGLHVDVAYSSTATLSNQVPSITSTINFPGATSVGDVVTFQNRGTVEGDTLSGIINFSYTYDGASVTNFPITIYQHANVCTRIFDQSVYTPADTVDAKWYSIPVNMSYKLGYTSGASTSHSGPGTYRLLSGDLSWHFTNPHTIVILSKGTVESGVTSGTITFSVTYNGITAEATKIMYQGANTIESTVWVRSGTDTQWRCNPTNPTLSILQMYGRYEYTWSSGEVSHSEYQWVDMSGSSWLCRPGICSCPDNYSIVVVSDIKELNCLHNDSVSCQLQKNGVRYTEDVSVNLLLENHIEPSGGVFVGFPPCTDNLYYNPSVYESFEVVACGSGKAPKCASKRTSYFNIVWNSPGGRVTKAVLFNAEA